MFPRKYKKQSKIKRFLLKLFNVHAFEKETLNIVNPDYKNSGNIFNLICIYNNTDTSCSW